MSARQMAADAEALTRAAEAIISEHADAYLASHGDQANFEAWVGTLHPEGVNDARLTLPQSPYITHWRDALARYRRQSSPWRQTFRAVGQVEAPRIARVLWLGGLFALAGLVVLLGLPRARIDATSAGCSGRATASLCSPLRALLELAALSWAAMEFALVPPRSDPTLFLSSPPAAPLRPHTTKRQHQRATPTPSTLPPVPFAPCWRRCGSSARF